MDSADPLFLQVLVRHNFSHFNGLHTVPVKTSDFQDNPTHWGKLDAKHIAKDFPLIHGFFFFFNTHMNYVPSLVTEDVSHTVLGLKNIVLTL